MTVYRSVALYVLLSGLILCACSSQKIDENVTGVEQHLQQLSEEGEFSGSVLIAHQGDILLSEGYGFADIENQIPNTSQTRFPIDWITAPFTSLAVMMLHAGGELSVDDGICPYIDECPEYWEKITIHHLLTHTSGISEWIQPWDQEADRPENSSEIIEQIKGRSPEFQAGEGFRYCAIGYLILGHIIGEVSGQTYESFLHKHIFDPLEMGATSLQGDDAAQGYNNGEPAPKIDPLFRFSAKGLFSTAEDLYLFVDAIFAEELIKGELLKKSLTGYAQTPSIDFPGAEYGYGWFVGELYNSSELFHGGGMSGYTSMMMHFPEDQLTIIVLRNQGMWMYDGLEKELAGMLFSRQN